MYLCGDGVISVVKVEVAVGMEELPMKSDSASRLELLVVRKKRIEVLRIIG